MKLASVSVKNFRSLKNLSFKFPENGLLALVGANNAGKSNIIRAIDALCGDQWFGREKVEDYDHYLRDKNATIEISLKFDTGDVANWSSTDKWPTFMDSRGRRRTDLKEEFPSVYLGADRTFDRHMSFYDWTLIGKIRRAFHHRARPIDGELKQKFAELVKVFDQVKGFSEFKNDFARFFDEMQADTSAKLSISFDPFTPSNYFKSMQVVAADPHLGEKVDIDELGEGSRNIVLLALLRSYAANFRQRGEGLSGILALEEPELYMHPQARRHLLKVLREIADAGMQVIISTHSASFIDTEMFDSVGRVVKVEDEENDGRFETKLNLVSRRTLVDHCKKTGVPTGKVDEANIGEFYKTTANPALNEGFFARMLVLVEGDTEELALPVFLASRGFDCDLLGISIVSVRGKSQIPKYWRLFSAFRIPLAVMADNDNDKRKANSNAGLATCFGVPVADMLKVSVASRHESSVGPKTPLLMLETNFEEALRIDVAARRPAIRPSLDVWEREARDLIKPVADQNKGQIARYVARKLTEAAPDFTPLFVELLIRVLEENGFQARVRQVENAPDDDMPF